ncbi:MAG: response regulator [Xanthomonadales bacterium]|nr:response regulator [Xanthomonadales bacterium]
MQQEGTESAARTRLLEEVVLRECLDSNARANQRGVWLTLVLVPFAAWRLGLHAPALQFHYWAWLMVVAALLRAVVVQRYLRQPPRADALGRWRFGFMLVAALVGVGWSALAWPLLEMGPDVRLLVYCLLMAIAAIGLFSFHAMAESFAAFLLPLVCSMLFTVVAGEVALAREVAIMVPLFGVIMVVGSSLVSANAADVIRARWRADELSRAARAASEAKSRFLARMSHEIRTPINGMMGMAELLANANLPAPHDHHARSVLHAGSTLLAVVDDVLDFAKIQASQMSLRPEPCDLAAWIERCVQPYRMLAAQRGLKFDVRIDPALPPRVLVDAQRLAQTVGNLLSNALKFTERGHLRVELNRVDEAHWSLTVEDSGIGVAAEDLQRMFEPFTQVDATAGRRYGGTGLGLSIVRQIVQLMDGDIRCDSLPARGSRFIMTLPLLPSPALASEPEAQPEESVALLSGCVLVAEDNALNLEITRLFLESMGVEVLTARDGAEAIAQHLARHPDLILMDCEMPGIDGLETTRRIRADETLKHVPIIALTAHALPEDRQASLDAGMDDYLSKPVDRQRLYRALKQYLRSAED